VNVVIPHEALVAFGLASIRMLALVLTAPFFAHSAIPLRVRTPLALLLAFTLAPSETDVALNTASLALAALGEALIGASLGIAASLLFAAIGLAAEVASVQGGLSAAAALDPASGATSVALGTLAQMMALLVFLAVDGHHELLRVVAHGFELLPPGALSLTSLANVASLGTPLFADGLRLAAPYTGALMLSNVVVGLLGRTIPQLNLLSVQLPAQIAIVFGLFALGAVPFCDAVAAAAPGSLDHALALVSGGAR
jgi:flagellar biosynthetic protein FliR